MIWILLGLLVLFLFFLFWSACVVAARADERAERQLQLWMASRSRDAGGLLQQGVTENANGA